MLTLLQFGFDYDILRLEKKDVMPMATVQTSLANSLDAAGTAAKMDASAKEIMKHRSILAKILKECTEEFKNYDLKYIEENCFVGEVEVSKVAVDQDMLDTDATIVGSNSEDKTNKEGTIHYDIVFDAGIPGTEKTVRMIINVEIQVDLSLSYAIVTRGIYYGSRLISRQKGTVFKRSEYQKIQKVYSIWICPDAKGETANSYVKYGITQQETFGYVNEPVENYDKMSIIIINLNDIGRDSEKEIIGFLSTLLSTTISVEEKKEELEKKYNFKMTNELEEDELDMCNIGTATLLKGIEQGRAEGRAEGEAKGRAEGEAKKEAELIEKLRKKGFTEEQIKELLSE